MKLIIVRLGLSPKSHPLTVGRFTFSKEHECYIWGGEAMRPAAFNKVTDSREWKQTIEDHGPLITVRAVGMRDMAKVRAKSPNGHPKEVVPA